MQSYISTCTNVKLERKRMMVKFLVWQHVLAAAMYNFVKISRLSPDNVCVFKDAPGLDVISASDLWTVDAAEVSCKSTLWRKSVKV